MQHWPCRARPARLSNVTDPNLGNSSHTLFPRPTRRRRRVGGGRCALDLARAELVLEHVAKAFGTYRQ